MQVVFLILGNDDVISNDALKMIKMISLFLFHQSSNLMNLNRGLNLSSRFQLNTGLNLERLSTLLSGTNHI